MRENVLEVEDYLSAADAGLYTSESESFGLSILETFPRQAGDRLPGRWNSRSRDRWLDGFLHPFEDLEAMAASIIRLAASPQLARRMGEQGRRDAEAKFSSGLVVPRYESVYRKILPLTVLNPAPSSRCLACESQAYGETTAIVPGHPPTRRSLWNSQEHVDRVAGRQGAALGAALAYYTVFSLAPLILVLLAVIGVIFRKIPRAPGTGSPSR